MAECDWLADELANDRDRKAMLRVAARWRSLADEDEGRSERMAPSGRERANMTAD